MATVFALLLSGCGRTPRPALIPVANLENKTVIMKSSTPFLEGAPISYSIKQECDLPRKLAEFTKDNSISNNVNVKFDDKLTKEDAEYYLDLIITGAISRGNAFLGHNKSTTVKGILYKNGKKLASFSGFRHSSGGFGGGFKGSCSVLGRTVSALGSDISKWIIAPTKGAYLGR